ncbi:MAG: hypothetical protein HGJ94_16470 [Desulfosarcina sp.]|nr:hypothetical protein [Desulfosarcina sp.]MBC2742249.1 hypothetical protein [Desulfosarcina sp.]MBC2765161.1 hypothetical protein [Desulfosarcina sp.]
MFFIVDLFVVFQQLPQSGVIRDASHKTRTHSIQCITIALIVFSLMFHRGLSDNYQ